MVKCLNCKNEVFYLPELKCPQCGFDYSFSGNVKEDKRKAKVLLETNFKGYLEEEYLNSVGKFVKKGERKINNKYRFVKILLENGIYDYSGAPDCPVCKTRKRVPVPNKNTLSETCSDIRCINKYIALKNGVENISQLPEVKIKKSEKLRTKYLDFNERLLTNSRRAVSMFKKYGVFNISQIQKKELLAKILKRLGIEKIETEKDYILYLEKVWRIILEKANEKNLKLIKPKNFEEFVLTIPEGNNEFIFKCLNCGIEQKRYFGGILEFLASEFGIPTKNGARFKLACKYCENQKKGFSDLEIRFLNLLKNHKVFSQIFDYYEYEFRVKKFSFPFEIDLVVYDRKSARPVLGIELDGIYWHSTKFLKDSSSNFEKFKSEYLSWLEKLKSKWLAYSQIEEFKVLTIRDLEIFNSNLLDTWVNKIILELGRAHEFFNLFNLRDTLIEQKLNGSVSKEVEDFLNSYHLYSVGIKNVSSIVFKNKENGEILAVYTFSPKENRKHSAWDNVVRYSARPFTLIRGALSFSINYTKQKLNIDKVKFWKDLRYTGIGKENKFNPKLMSYQIFDNEKEKIYHRLYIRRAMKREKFKGTELEFVFQNPNYEIIPTPGSLEVFF